MSDEINKAKEAIYLSIINDNEDLDECINTLKIAMKKESVSKAIFDPSRLVQNNREGRKRMQSYFKRRGVTVVFEQV